MFKKMLLLAMALCLLAGCATTKPAVQTQVPVDNNPTSKATPSSLTDILNSIPITPSDFWGPGSFSNLPK